MTILDPVSHAHPVSWFSRDPGGSTIFVKPEQVDTAETPTASDGAATRNQLLARIDAVTAGRPE